jgi:hypothetical protein
MGKKVMCVCWKCGKSFQLGVEGITLDGNDICDVCARVERDQEHFAWLPEENELHMQDIFTGEKYILNREERLGNHGTH